MKRDLYEKVDGKETPGIKPEESSLAPGSVKMHREANTSDKDAVLIKNHFTRADVAGISSEVDLDLKYSDAAVIKKSNGMVTESHVYFSEQLNLGEPIRGDGGFDVTMMKITVKSHASLIETLYFGYDDSDAASDFQLFEFVRLIVPKQAAASLVSTNETESQMSSNVSMSSEEQIDAPLKRSRRSVYHNVSNANASLIAEIWRRIGPVCLNVKNESKVFDRRIFGIRVTAIAYLSVHIDEMGMPEIQVELKMFVGRLNFTVLVKNYTIPPQELMGFHVQLPARRLNLVSKLSQQT